MCVPYGFHVTWGKSGDSPLLINVNALEGDNLRAGCDDAVFGLDGLAAPVFQLHLHAAVLRQLAPPLLVLYLQAMSGIKNGPLQAVRVGVGISLHLHAAILCQLAPFNDLTESLGPITALCLYCGGWGI